MPSFEIQADIFTCLSVFDSPKGSSDTFKTHRNISLYFKRRYLTIYKYFIARRCWMIYQTKFDLRERQGINASNELVLAPLS